MHTLCCWAKKKSRHCTEPGWQYFFRSGNIVSWGIYSAMNDTYPPLFCFLFFSSQCSCSVCVHNSTLTPLVYVPFRLSSGIRGTAVESSRLLHLEILSMCNKIIDHPWSLQNVFYGGIHVTLVIKYFYDLRCSYNLNIFSLALTGQKSNLNILWLSRSGRNDKLANADEDSYIRNRRQIRNW